MPVGSIVLVSSAHDQPVHQSLAVCCKCARVQRAHN